MAQAALDLNPLDSEAVDDLVARALADIEAAADLEALKAVKSALLGDQAPLVLANRKIGQLAPQTGERRARTSAVLALASRRP